MDLDALFILLQPWLRPFLAFVFFTFLRYFYRAVLLRVLHRFNSKTSFEYGEDLLNAFEKPVHFFLFIFGVEFDLALSNVVSTTLRILLIILGFVMIAKEWNYDITGFIASLSIGSLAVALAAKDSLANVFGSLVIIIDKPFVIGDWISANGIEGTVEKITFRSTCLRTFPQELVYIPNSLLSNTAITNFSKREKRRLDFVLGLTYDTTYQQMEKFVGRLREYLMHHDGVYDDGITVNFQDFGGSSLDIRIICYTKASAYASFMDVRQQINIDIMKMLEEENLGCAFPSTSVYFETPLVQKQAAPPTDAPKTEVQA